MIRPSDSDRQIMPAGLRKEEFNMYKFVLLDPRRNAEAIQKNNQVFYNSGITGVYGIEVTIPELAEGLVRNIDPQHTGPGGTDTAAIEVAVSVELPPDGATLATIRADLDSVGSMAILAIRARGESLEPAMGRVQLVAESDKFLHGPWRGSKGFPTRDNPWPEGKISQLAAIAAAVADFKTPLGDRVALVERWLLIGEEPASYREKVEAERLDLVTALRKGEIKIEVSSEETPTGKLAAISMADDPDNGRYDRYEIYKVAKKVVVVESSHRAATAVGYMVAPVVLAINPVFPGPGGPYLKYTICVFETKFADIKSALAELNELEPGWGGSPTIGGSPQGVSSRLAKETVLEVLKEYCCDVEVEETYYRSNKV